MKKITYLFFGLALVSNLYAAGCLAHSYSKYNRCINKIECSKLRKAALSNSKEITNLEI